MKVCHLIIGFSLGTTLAVGAVAASTRHEAVPTTEERVLVEKIAAEALAAVSSASSSKELPVPKSPPRPNQKEEEPTAEERALLEKMEAEMRELEAQLTPAEKAEVSGIVGRVWAQEAQRFAVSRVVRSYAQAAHAGARYLAIAELQDRRFPRADAIRALQSFLADPSLKVRVFAAQLLYQLGSADGREVLVAALRSAPELPLADLPEVLKAVEVLNRNREVIPADLLIQFAQLRGVRGLIGIMATQGDPAFASYLQAAGREDPVGMMTLLGRAGDDSGYAIAREQFEKTRRPRVKVMAAVTMFRLRGDREAWEYVLGVARGGHATGDGEADADARQQARRDLQVIKHEAARDCLRELAVSTNTSASSGALASLFYVQQDYEFIDRYLKEFLADPRAHANKDHALLGRLAAARDQPELNALIESLDDGFRATHIDPMRGLPPESWIGLYLSDLPLRSVPPSRPAGR